MQTVGNYLFSRNKLEQSFVDECTKNILGLLEDWLEEKGAAIPISANGKFISKTREDEGSYKFSSFSNENDALIEISLKESSRSGQIFNTTISIISALDYVTVYTSLQAANISGQIAPTFTDARCPKIIRQIIERYEDWEQKGEAVPRAAIEAFGEVGGLTLADKIQDANRIFPIVVVSHIDDEELWPELTANIARDLIGLAQVFLIDDDASWALSSRLKKENSCYLGAIRLYWPVAGTAGRLDSTVWTSSKLLPIDESEDAKAQAKFRSSLRYKLMSTSSLAISAPIEISIIKTAETRRRFHELAVRGQAVSEAEELIEILMTEKQVISDELDEAKKRIFSLSNQLQSVLLKPIGLAESSEPANDDKIPPPVGGEVRYYKKTHSGPSHDVLVYYEDCGHNAWQNSAKADKAKKGIIRLEGSDQWKLVQHCGTCTGGGVWRVKW